MDCEGAFLDSIYYDGKGLSSVEANMTDDIPIREPDQIRQSCAHKLRAVQVSDHFQAILGCLLGEAWTAPRLVEMVITPDGHLLGRCDDEMAFKAFLGASEDLIKNIHGGCPDCQSRRRRDRLSRGKDR